MLNAWFRNFMMISAILLGMALVGIGLGKLAFRLLAEFGPLYGLGAMMFILVVSGSAALTIAERRS